MKKLMFIFFVLMQASIAQAQIPQGDPSAMMQQLFPGMEMGKLTGEVFELKEGKKSPLSGQEIALIVFQGEDELLKLHKATDTAGVFEFKNIFRDPQFHYVIGTFYQEKMYVYDRISLEKAQETKHVELQVGNGSPYLIEMPKEEEINEQEPQMDQAMPFNTSGEKADKSVRGLFREPHQKVSLALCMIVVLFCAYFYWGHGRKGVSKVALGNFDRKESNLMVLAWLRDEFKKGQLPEAVFKSQEEKLLARLKEFYISAQ